MKPNRWKDGLLLVIVCLAFVLVSQCVRAGTVYKQVKTQDVGYLGRHIFYVMTDDGIGQILCYTNNSAPQTPWEACTPPMLVDLSELTLTCMPSGPHARPPTVNCRTNSVEK